MGEGVAFECPRCGGSAHADYYGPCGSCVDELRAAGGDARSVESVEYVPKMNVTPNAVATKE